MKAKEFIVEYKKDRKAPKFNIKPRTGHAPTQTGAGEHRDKKKEQKQGYQKHKGKDVAEGKSALEKFRSAAAEREKKHDDIEAKRQAAAKQGKENMTGAIDRLEKHLKKEDTDVPFNQCPSCGGPIVHESLMNEKQDACYHKVRSRYKVWPSAYASGALVQCRKKGAKNWGNKSKK